MNNQIDGLWWFLAVFNTAVGGGVFVYGFRQRAALPLVAGLALNVLPTLMPTGRLALLLTVLLGGAWWVLAKIQ